MKTHALTPQINWIPLIGSDLVNAYLVGDVLIDSGARFTQKKLLQFLQSRTLAAHVLTHAHNDHQGASQAVCTAFQIPLMCGEGDREAMESGDQRLLMRHPDSLLARFANRLAGPAHPVSEILSEGDQIAGLTVIETPGHTPGHLAFWHEQDRVLILGDVLFYRNPMTLQVGLTEPPDMLTFDRVANLASARKLAALNPEIICFGHGSPLLDGERFRHFIESLPQV